ncbi:hypothetical protein Ami103574_00055 [Aminipila butyrica]|uniref:Uncharacterized protein n=1 Tax=Aminipila butyrica TaxID=433296 RepID=A0A858BUQ0_9FIRM|nr:hypothetical protein [Aminipila butyrica]QIB67806.1 hypothetical protein Ami103574_00055 [Aminipila butyrica]
MSEKKIVDLGKIEHKICFGIHVARWVAKNRKYRKNEAWELRDEYTERADNKRKVRKIRLVDRRNDKYYEKIIDLETNEVTHFCEEPLSEHYGHGSAKVKKEK